MSKTRTSLLSIGLTIITITFIGCGKTRQEKTLAIINKLNIVENQKNSYEFQLEPLKYQATGSDSLRILELEKQLSDDKTVNNKICSAFNKLFNNNEIDDIYNFIQTSAFNKFFNSTKTYRAIESEFKSIDNEIEQITNNLSMLNTNIMDEKPVNKFEPISVDKEDGFYATVDYTYSTEYKNIKLEDDPSLTSKDILEAKKVYNENRAEISIVLTKKGARKFYLLTKENIGKPIAIVINKEIVSIPKVHSEIMGGKVNISGNFSEKEIDKMIKKLTNE
jgi:preprotein translocase subunit SecD